MAVCLWGLSGPGLAQVVERHLDPVPKNVIVMISDGCGHNHVEAANLYQEGRTGVQIYEQFSLVASMTTFPFRGGYDAQKAWSDFDYVKQGATDSAAAATAMSTGIKTTTGAIGVAPDGRRLKHVLELAEERGKATGVVTSVMITHATPAGFVAHNVSRDNYVEIAREMIQKSPVDVLMGCGHPGFGAAGQPAEKPNYKYVGGRRLWLALRTNRAGRDVDADHNGRRDDAWAFVEERAAFRELGRGETPKRVMGVAQAEKTLRYGQYTQENARPAETGSVDAVPTLAEMTTGALNVLEDDPDGMFLMVEGGAVDWASHAGDAAGMIGEQIRFNRAVEKVVEWIQKNGGWEETLLIVTADHECGYLCAPTTNAGELPWAYLDLENRGEGSLPGLSWQSSHHTNLPVPIYAQGPLSETLKTCLENKGSKLGPYLDNTDLGRVIHQAWEER